jgi:hypothetical protein
MSASSCAIEERLRGVPNPFAGGVVGTVWEAPVADVPEIHAAVFEELLRVVRSRLEGRPDRCLLLYGHAGSGKTHLLRRLRLALEAQSAPRIAFSWIWMGTSPAMVWRYLRRSFASDLVWRPAGRPQLDELLEQRRGAPGAVRRRDLAVVLEHLAAGRHERDARAWLSGEELPEEALARLGLAPSEADDTGLEDEAQRLFEALAAFLAPAPFVLCLDQLEALQSHPGDTAGLFAIGKLLASLYNIPNAVVIGTVQEGLIGALDRTLSQAERDRYRPLALNPLRPEEIRALVRARLAAQPALAELRPACASEFWPIEVDRVTALATAREGVTARRVLFECERLFEHARRVWPGAPPLDQFLREQFEARRREAAKRLAPENSGDILSDGLPRLLHLRGAASRYEGLPRWLDLEVRPAQGPPVGVALANTAPQGLWRKLKKAFGEWDPGERRLVLLRDALHPLGPHVRAAREWIGKLEQRGARWLIPSREGLIALDALRRLLAAAESGDLSYEGETPPVRSVEDWIRRNIPEALARFLNDIAAGGSGDPLLDRLAALLAEEKIISVAEAAAALETTPEEVERCARENRDRFGLLLGAEPVVWEPAPAPPGT